MNSSHEKSGFSGMLMLGLAAVVLGSAAVMALLQQRPIKGWDVVIDGRIRVAVEVAATPPAREKGLSGHAPLGADEGMLFVFETETTPGFWMKDMLFPLDIIWIRDGVIVDITTDVPAPQPGDSLPAYFPREAVDQVLEVNAGFARQHGLKLGLPATLEATP